MSVSRAVVLTALAVAVVVVAAVILNGGGTHEYHLRFQNAGQLVKGDDVQVGGRRVGSVEKITLTDDNQADIKISVDKDFAPLHAGTKATIRATSLSGIANRYVALDLGPNNAPEIGDGAIVPASSTTSPVDLDQLFATFDPATRKGLQQLIRGSATWYAGKGRKANVGAKYFNPALSTTSRLVDELVSDQQVFRQFVTSSSHVVTSLAARRADLSGLVGNANTTAGAIAAENASLSDALGRLPATLRRSNTTFVNLRSTLDDLDTLVAASKPATKDLAPFLRVLRPLVADARPTIADLRLLVRKPGSGNDLIELLRQAPGLEKVARPALADTVTAFQKSAPVLKFIRPYTPDLVGWFRDFGVGASNYDANGHFARIQPIFNAFSFADNVLTPIPPGNRGAGLQAGQLRRCPGTASQPPVDRSAPWRDEDGKLDCDPTQVLPGP